MNKEMLGDFFSYNIASTYDALGEEEKPFNDLANELKDEHYQWVIAISVGLLISVYANGFGNISLSTILTKGETVLSKSSVYQCVNLALMSTTLLIILFMYGRYLKYIYPKLIKINDERWLKDDKYTEKIDALKLFRYTVFGWRLPVRLILYTLFIAFWFGIKYSFAYFNNELYIIQNIEGNYYGNNAIILLFVTFMIFLFLLESPVIYSYIRIKQIYKRSRKMP